MEPLIDLELIKQMTPAQSKKFASELVLNMTPEQSKELVLIWAEYHKNDKSILNRSLLRSKSTTVQELDSLIGLKEAKDYINKQISFCKLKKDAAKRGRILSDISNNMVFIGNPGTCKTTVAKFFAKRLYEEGVTTNPTFIEASRAEIISKYAGHTAKNVKQIVKKALGGVLFIDEAYSLIEQDDRDGFGEEAVNTLLQEVENHRGDLIVIIAGYPQKMENFLDANPGLKSRFSQVIHFDDYTSEELYHIAERIADQNGFLISEDAKEKIISIFEKALQEKNFGNGRFARSLVEQAQLSKAANLSMKHRSFDKLSNEELFTLVAEDFMMPKGVDEYVKKKKVGFDV